MLPWRLSDPAAGELASAKSVRSTPLALARPVDERVGLSGGQPAGVEDVDGDAADGGGAGERAALDGQQVEGRPQFERQRGAARERQAGDEVKLADAVAGREGGARLHGDGPADGARPPRAAPPFTVTAPVPVEPLTSSVPALTEVGPA